jgi:hypothetical protein
MTDAFWAYGSKLQLGDGDDPEVFADIAEIIELTPPAESRDDIDVSNMQSPNATREHIPGWKDGGEVTFKANWLPTNATHDSATGLRSIFGDNVNHNWKIVLPGSPALLTISFAGHLNAFEPDLPLEEQGQLSGTIKVSGSVTYSV